MASSILNPFASEPNTSKHLDAAREAGAQALAKAKEAGKEMIDMTKDACSQTIDRAKGMGTEALEKGKGAAAAAGAKATQAAATIGKMGDAAVAAAGREITGLGDAVARKSPQEGLAGSASQAVADYIKDGGHYLEEAQMTGMARDLENVIRSHPLPAVLISLGIGYCLGRIIRSGLRAGRG